MALPLCSPLSPYLLGFLAFGAWEDSEIGGRGQPLGLADLQRGEGKGWCGHVGREAVLLPRSRRLARQSCVNGSVLGPCCAPLRISGLRDPGTPGLALALQGLRVQTQREASRVLDMRGAVTRGPSFRTHPKWLLLRF